MSEAAKSMLWSQLTYQLPMLIVAVVALVMAVVFWRRAHPASACVALGAVLLLFTGLVFPVVTAMLYDSGDEGRPSADTIKLMNQIGLVASIVRAGAVGILVAAAFVGRGSRRE